ncbi:hypothetical protein SLEP1_g53861 [Rubroshorea leprosula]|uniref:Reverse transcriptase Ty1/copia-type domain-containing protein n=1 Tax=Rubroshorea leprosula TaxID=152421 RepID=A0AAV5MEJ0_9ROSI|nr:hypothetical protein SLEP1_g53861 [Rubroshorea leprosula]
MARTMICENDLPKSFWAEAIATSCYLLNRVMVRPILNKNPYEIYKGRKPKISYFRAFGCKCFVLNNGKDSLGKFDSKSEEGIFVGYSTSSKAYHMYNKHTKVVEESIHVVFDETNPICSRKSCNDDDVDAIGKQIKDINLKEDNTKEAQDEKNEEDKHEEVQQTHELREPTFPRERSYVKGNEILGDPSKGVITRSHAHNTCAFIAFISQIEPNNLDDSLNDPNWVMAMQEELAQFERNKVWNLISRPKDHPIIGTKWVFRNKLDENGIVVRNKARLVAKGYCQEERIDFDETFASIARLEAIRMLLAFSCFKGFTLYQMDVKSAFLNGYIQEEVYVEQPPDFEDPSYPNHAYKLSKALYSLKQAPRAWYERLSSFFLANGFFRGRVNTTLFVKNKGQVILIVQIYVDDIVFGATNDFLCQEFSKAMQGEFEMSMMGELNFFLGLQIKQSKEGIFINQSKYPKEMLKKFGMETCKPIATPMSTSINLDKGEGGSHLTNPTRGFTPSEPKLLGANPRAGFAPCEPRLLGVNPRARFARNPSS